MSRLTILSDVVLPQPDGPTRTQILPAGTCSDRSLTAPGVGLARALRGRRVVALGDVVELDDRGFAAGARSSARRLLRAARLRRQSAECRQYRIPRSGVGDTARACASRRSASTA